MTTQAAPHWDLSNVYAGLESDAFQAAVTEMKDRVKALDAYQATHQIARGGPAPEEPAALNTLIAGYLDRMNELLTLSATLRSYLSSFVSTDSYNTAARRLVSELEPVSVSIQRQQVLFQGWIGTLAEKEQLFRAALAIPGTVQDHAFYLEETAEQSRYLLSVDEETLAAELSLSGGSAWGKLHGVLTSQLRVTIGQGDEIQKLPVTVVQNMKHDPDEATRRRAYEAEIAAWASIREPLAACMNGVKGEVVTLNKRRGRQDALHQPLDQARIDRQTLEAMLAAVRDSFPSFRRYWQAKAHLLGKEALAWWDLFAPVGRLEKRYTYEGARDFILEQLGAFSQRIVIFTRRAFDQQWIDAEPRDGKRGGAFCMRVPAVEESRILCNFDGSLDQVLTLAHELGHAYHNECMAGKTMLQRRTPMTLAETASIFNETIVTDALLAQTETAEEELALLETFLGGASQVIVDIYSRFLFEKEVFVRREEAELSADDLGDAMLRAQRETYGDGLDADTLNPYMWAWKPHYYRTGLSFYNFPYTFGLLFGLGLYAIYQQKGSSFLTEYDSLLRSTGEAAASDLAARFGIDIRQKAFWTASIAVIQNRIERYLSLAQNQRPA